MEISKFKMKKDLEEEIKKAEEVCRLIDKRSDISLLDKMKPWVHLNNLLLIKAEKLLSMELRTLFQWCETCKTETVFNYDTVKCTVCNNRPINYKPKEEENVTNTTNKGKNKEPGLEGT